MRSRERRADDGRRPWDLYHNVMGITVLCLLETTGLLLCLKTRRLTRLNPFSNCFCLAGTQVKTRASMSYAESISTPGGYPKHCRVNFLKMQVGRIAVNGVARRCALYGHVRL